MKVSLLSWTHNPELIIATAAKTCYSPGTVEEMYKSLLDKDYEISNFVKKLQNMGHLSPFEHASFTFSIDGVSRVLLAQITRHRIASFSVQSQRYVNYELDNPFDFEIDKFFVTPELLLDSNSPATDVYLMALDSISDVYSSLVINLVDEGFSVKEAAENARYILPGAMKTNLVMTMNARQLIHFFELRCCNRAQKEIRDLAWEILSIVKDKCPTLFSNCGPKCLTSKCGEGKMNCGKPYKKEN